MKHLLTARPVSEGASESPAYTTIINAGKLKGKTPAAALAEDGAKGRESVKEPGTVAEAEPGRISKECSTDSGNRGSVTALS